ncbi:hypothetical protein E6P09_18070 (plasmid) [Haloferax mediterranei ATCC 33500]|uniref:Uncharacterized protein n=1 Tax=Haloferax mediterranei (strain ATCC 33500 / DSM 1411 / JCM 8866 / NBRC 14739 / NCIMB 2177 / R-4) TaxID=523841 RepID=I3RA12_HALMT|nr:hypothetical protein [Haloferax mediterranei]AFK21072.1 hypothetical protein HFX_5240 [Haloferax mediterranei ATCC 33500]AHZ24072.1 hypothetical protein BM92_17850 [Haloferax mediterranei ATCC 33500]EMA05145.1 hypothetical protein C439_00060 [Haloferax mediterranei ATCC 33500]MDX5989779.1 hypothetical protein [Haloferax mediterranei ATCC 33500]QCQ77223.1 hypothetical protein E6P09_18070 [Haloferax mediterranei ATCC 33500]
MKRPLLVFVTVLLVFGVTLTVATPAASVEQTNATASEPGPTVSTVIAVQDTTVDQSMRIAEFQSRLTAAETTASRARVVAGELDRVETRLDTLETRLDRYQEARENGSISPDIYSTRVAPVVASARSLDARVDRIRIATDRIDAETLRDANVTQARIETVQSRIDRVVAVDEAAVEPGTFGPKFYRQIATVVESYNNAEAVDLGVLGSHINGERINLHITTADGDTAVVSFRMTGNNRIRDLRAGPHPDATLRVTTDESTARRLLNDDHPGVAVSRAVVDGEIRIDGIGRYNAVKWLFLTTALDTIREIASRFGLMVFCL